MMQVDPLVSPAWLAARLDPASPASGPNPLEDLVILDATLPPVGVSPVVDTRARYLAEHLPGALFFDIEQHSDHATSLPHMLPSAEVFARSMAELGVSSSGTIVVYEQAGVFSAPRARWMLRTMGAEQVYLLDGGLEAWRAAGFRTESGLVTRSSADFQARLDRAAVRDYMQIEAVINRNARTDRITRTTTAGTAGSKPDTQPDVQIVDARSAARFHGTAPEPRAGLSSGHMPGATSLPYTELVEAGRLKNVAGLRTAFAACGIELNAPIITTCGSGVTAAVVALGLERAGATQISLYDGSWAEYAQQPDAQIEQVKPHS